MESPCSTDLHLQSVSIVSVSRLLTWLRSKQLDWAALPLKLGLCYINTTNDFLKVLSRKL